MILAKKKTHRIAVTSLFLLLIGFALAPDRTSATRQSISNRDEREDEDNRLIALLDDSIQQRFKDVDKGFGYRRIVKPRDTPHRFKPENARELKIVKELRTAGLDVSLYLAGRRVLGEKPDPTAIVARRLIQGPVSTIPGDYHDAEGLPGPEQLWDQSRAAMLAFEFSDMYKFDIGKWSFSARPVRATEQSCLDCHNAGLTSSIPLARTGVPAELQSTKPLRIRDALGIVLYAYQRRTR